MLQGVIQALINDSKVVAAVGNGKQGKVKIYPVLADELDDTPFSVLTITSNQPNQCRESVSVMDLVSFDVNTYSKDYPQLDNIDNLIRFCLDGLKGPFTGIDLDISFQGQRDGFDTNQYYVRISSYQAFVTRRVG